MKVEALRVPRTTSLHAEPSCLLPFSQYVLWLWLLCSLGQNLAKLELQVVLATFLARFQFIPGPQLSKAAELAAKTGQPPISAVYELAEVHVTLQPAGGKMLLFAAPR